MSVSPTHLQGQGVCNSRGYLGEVPILSSRPYFNISGFVEGWDHDPGIIERQLGSHRVQGNGNVSAASDAMEPTLFQPSRQSIRGLVTRHAQGLHNIGNGDRILG